jgi:hypothetical protein
VPNLYEIRLDENELKMLLVAIRQVKHTFSIADAQSRAAGEELDSKYQGVQESYEELEKKIQRVLQEPREAPQQPFRVK